MIPNTSPCEQRVDIEYPYNALYHKTRIDKSIHLQSKTDIQKFTVGEQFMVYGFQWHFIIHVITINGIFQ